ncbi:MAG: twin-arginine translocation signal domain-containing protein [Pseudomonadales bacterium]|nr:twin-arginine translocation signal domain-containing protein [Pseudomonadales bacterium]
MKKNKIGLTRRDLLKGGVAAAGLLLTTGCSDSGGGTPGDGTAGANASGGGGGLVGENPITIENAKPGTQDWRLTNTSTVPGLANPHCHRS